ncbi:hypothetical protein ACX8Z9_16955 [Arthrobacter halodurans]|uniref:Uncharacterized protein n=1 Tax=Arthrobacter halodurans TaxID=516699 RepID=A0ABV4UVR5_9MICC
MAQLAAGPAATPRRPSTPARRVRRAALPAADRPAPCPAVACARERRSARAAALAAGLAVAAHAWVLVAHPHGPWLTGLLAFMAAVCAACAVEAWRRPSREGLAVLLGMSAAMAVFHLALAQGLPGGHAAHGAGALPPGAAAAGPGAAAAAPDGAWMLGIAALELGVALAAGIALRRRA